MAVKSSKGIAYECSSFANPTLAALSLSREECKVVSDELNDKVQEALLRPLQLQKEFFPQLAEHIDQAIEEIKSVWLSKVCICTTDGCNDPNRMVWIQVHLTEIILN